MKSVSTLEADLTISTCQLQASIGPGALRRAQKGYLCQIANKSPAHANVSLPQKSWGYQRTLGTTDGLEDFSDRCVSSSGGCCAPFLAPHQLLMHFLFIVLRLYFDYWTRFLAVLPQGLLAASRATGEQAQLQHQHQ